MTPDGTPIVGATPLRNLYLNTGHGTLGWTMACGSARVLADLMSGRAPDIRADDLSVFRYLGTDNRPWTEPWTQPEMTYMKDPWTTLWRKLSHSSR